MKLPASFNIIPVKEKQPLISWQKYILQKQTTEEKLEFLKMNPNGKIGIICGIISGILVLDVDGSEGEAALRDYKLPRTATVKTPHGRHYYFKFPLYLKNKVSTKVGLLNKVDIRGEGGYVVNYGWENPPNLIPIAPPPQWLIDLLPNKDLIFEKPSFSERLKNITNGNRNASFTSLAGNLRRDGYSPEEIFDLLVSKAREVSFPEKELQTICLSVGRYTPHIETQQVSSIDAFLETMETIEWICEPIIAKQTLGFIAGLPETGKTWAMIDLAVECARGGGKWLGCFNVAPAKVLFIDQERFKAETQRRFRAVLLAKNLQSKDLKDSLFIKNGTTTRINLESSYVAFRKELSEIQPDIVIVDSFTTFHSAEDNNRQSIQEVLERIKSLRNEFKCTFLFIHHENKMAFNKEDIGEPSIAQMAGSIALPAAAELVLTVRRQDVESSMVYMTKSTLASTIAPFLIKIQDVEDNGIKIEAY